MVQNGQITFYTHVYSPFCHRVHLALEEAKAEYTLCTINLMDKPAWYAEKVNPVGKIPAITYGGPKTAPDEPSPESEKINESLVILEFLADLFPESGLLPADPVLRARARLFMNAFDTSVFDGFKTFFYAYSSSAAPGRALLDALDVLQKRLPASGFAIGDWSIADMAAAPLLARMEVLLKNDLGTFPVGEGQKLWKALQEPRFERLLKYLEDVKARPSFKNTSPTGYPG